MKIAATILVGLIALLGVAWVGVCPCGPMPGVWLSGSVKEAPVSDWSFVNDRAIAPLCQVQITTWRPHAINLNCMSDDGALYVSCSQCADKGWSNDALTHPDGQILAGDHVYPVTLRRVTDAPTLDVAWQARLRKIGAEAQARPDHWWSFELTSRQH